MAETSVAAFSSPADSDSIAISDEDIVSFCTPPMSRQPLQSSQYTTPKPLGITRLRDLKGNCSSPALTVPASPFMKRLGYGTGVGVYLLERSPKIVGEIRSPWAIKKINKIRTETHTAIYRERLEYEASVLKKLNHPNIVGYRGFSNPPGAQPILAMESASASLNDLVEARAESGITAIPFPAKYIEKVAVDIANALDYLHEEKRMIHGDLKSGNVLVFGNFHIAKLCDFGVCQELRADGTINGDSYIGTEIWNPMEIVLAHEGTPKWPVTSKVDIYPFGLTIYEMLALQHPHISQDNEDDYDDSSAETVSANSSLSFDESAFEARLAKRLGTRPPLPEYDFDAAYNKILEVFYCCTEENPTKRPSAEDIITLLSLILN